MEQDLEHVLEQLKANQLTELDLNNKDLTKAQVIRLAEALKHNQSLTTLNLGGNQLSVAGAEKISEALKVNRTLTTLDLSDNELEVAGIENLSEALKVNQSLTTLYLSDNELGAVGAEKISEALKVNRTLTTLDLSDSELDAAGTEPLSEALKMNQTLTSLNLEGNTLDNATIQVIEETLQTNRDQIKSTRHQTLLIVLILLRHAHSPDSKLPRELWTIIMQQLDFPSVKQGHRNSHAITSFLTQPNIFKEFNERLQSKTSFRLIETHRTKLSESRFNFLTPQATFLSGAANTISQASHEYADQQQLSFLNTK